MTVGQRVALIVLVIAIASGLTAAVTSLGTETRWVDIITFYASGLASGISLVAFFRARRPARRRVIHPDAPPD
jgi:hypothetical protein